MYILQDRPCSLQILLQSSSLMCMLTCLLMHVKGMSTQLGKMYNELLRKSRIPHLHMGYSEHLWSQGTPILEGIQCSSWLNRRRKSLQGTERHRQWDLGTCNQPNMVCTQYP